MILLNLNFSKLIKKSNRLQIICYSLVSWFKNVLKHFEYITSIIVGSICVGGVGGFSLIIKGGGVGGAGAVCLKILNKNYQMFKLALFIS
jgi:hypothetical protein